MKNKRSVLVLFTSTLAVVVACGGSSNSDVFGAGTGDGGGSGTDAMTNPPGSDATVDGASSEGGGTDGGGKQDAAKDAARDATIDAGNLCASTGGTEATSLCCKSAGDFPDTCKVGACGCSPASSHTVKSCLCPVTECYDAVLGCRAP